MEPTRPTRWRMVALFFAVFSFSFDSVQGFESDGREQDDNGKRKTRPVVSETQIQHNRKRATLVVIFGGVRGGEPAWQSMYDHLLDANRADLALMVGAFNHSATSLARRAQYVWEVPEYGNDWSAAYDAEYGFGAGKTMGMIAAKNSGGWNSGGWSGPIQWYLKAAALRNVKKLRLDAKYDAFVLTRSDYYYACNLDVGALLDRNPSAVWVPQGLDFYGLNDRLFVVGGARDLDVLLDLVSCILKLDPNGQKKCNAEVRHLDCLKHGGILDRVQRFPYVQFTVAADGDSTRWGQAKGYIRAGVKLKYIPEYSLAMETCGDTARADPLLSIVERIVQGGAKTRTRLHSNGPNKRRPLSRRHGMRNARRSSHRTAPHTHTEMRKKQKQTKKEKKMFS